MALYTQRPRTTPYTNPQFKITLKHTSHEKTPKQQVAALLYKNQIALTTLIPINTGYIAKTDKETDIEKIITLAPQLATLELKPLVPPQLQATRTLIVRNLDDTIGTQTPEDLIEEITKHQYNKNPKIDSIIKMPNKTRILKIVCSDTNTAQTLSRNGFYAYSYKISPSQINTDTFTYIDICYKCYTFQDHTTRNCPSTEQHCSNCANTGHSHHDCTNKNTVRCVNCLRAISRTSRWKGNLRMRSSVLFW